MLRGLTGVWHSCRDRTIHATALAVLLAVASIQPAAALQPAPPCPTAVSSPLVVASALLDLGCPTSDPFATAASEQLFEHGSMLWLAEWGIISVLREDGGYDGYDDQYSPGEPESAGLTPPRDGLLVPLQGFGKIWRKIGGSDAPIGWATDAEASYVATVQYFQRGAVIQRADGTAFVLATFNQARGQWALTPSPMNPGN